MYNMQEADYSGEAMFRIIRVVEQCGKIGIKRYIKMARSIT